MTESKAVPRAREESRGQRPIERRSIVDLVLDEVRHSILDGSMGPGSSVSIAELSVRLDVSHIPVREALRRLEGEGLIELRPGRSAVVAPLTAAGLEEIYSLRTLIEGDAMARAVKQYDAAELAEIERAHARLAVEPGDDEKTLSTRHLEFHRLLARPAASEWTRRLLDLLWQAGERYMFLILGDALTAPGGRSLQDTHTGLVAAAREASPATARHAVREHLDHGIARIAPELDRSEVGLDLVPPSS